MSNVQQFANNHSTQFARLLAKLIRKHIPNHPKLTPAFNQANQSMYLHRVLYAYYKMTTKQTRHQKYMQAAALRNFRNNPHQLVNCANTPTAYL